MDEPKKPDRPENAEAGRMGQGALERARRNPEAYGHTEFFVQPGDNYDAPEEPKQPKQPEQPTERRRRR